MKGDGMGITRPARLYKDLSRDELVNEYAYLVKIIASRLAIRLPSHIDINDLISVGIAGLIEAIDRFDPSRGVKMETYLSFRIRGAMLDELRRMDWVPRSVRQKARQLEEECAKIEARVGRAPTEEEIAEQMGMDHEELHRFLQDASGIAVLNLEDLGLNRNGEDRDILECIADPNSEDPFTEMRLKETQEMLGRIIDELPERERLVLSLYYYEELNLKEIGEVLGVTESRVCQLHSQAILRLKGKLKRLKNEI